MQSLNFVLSQLVYPVVHILNMLTKLSHGILGFSHVFALDPFVLLGGGHRFLLKLFLTFLPQLGKLIFVERCHVVTRLPKSVVFGF